jgi:hypothetical protein
MSKGIKAAGVEHRRGKFKIDEVGGEWFVVLLAGNGAELMRTPPLFKRGNAERSLERIKAAIIGAEAEQEP